MNSLRDNRICTLVLPAAFGLLFFCLAPRSAVGQVSIYTRSYDAARTGANLFEKILTPESVNAKSFGKLYTVPTDGHVYAQPLYVSGLSIAGAVHNVLYVVSMRNTVYAINADTGATFWTRNFGTPVTPQDVEKDQNISWNTGIGILSTPVIDPDSNYMYFVSANEHLADGVKVFEFYLNAMDITTGDPVHGSPTLITGTYTSPDLVKPLSFDAKQHNQRAGLALANGNVYIAFASHDDQYPYHGWVMAYSTSTLQQMAIYSDTTTGIEGGIWNAGGAPTVDGEGNLYISTGNGSFGKTPSGMVQTGNSFIKLSPTLQLLDYFTPYNSELLNSGDQDLGASGLLLIPNTNYLLGGGKQGVLYLVDKEKMGGFDASADTVVQEFQGVYGKGTSHIHGAPIYFNSAVNGPTTYVWGENDTLRAYLYDERKRLINTTPIATSTMTAPVTNNDGAMPGGFMGISADGNTGGILWASTPFNGDSVHAPIEGVLYAFDAETLQVLWTDKTNETHDEVGFFSKYCPPIVANGKMFIPTFGTLPTADGTGSVIAYGLLPVLKVNVASIGMTVGATLPALTGTVTGLQSGDTLGGTVVVKYTTTATSASPVGTYPISATVTGRSVSDYNIVVSAGMLTISAAPTNGNLGSGAISYSNGFSGSNLNLQGRAQIEGTHLRLTDGDVNEAASAFYPTAVNVQSFTNDFTFQLLNPVADGITMVIQDASPTALGAPGGALGYAGIAKSVAVKFDLYGNTGETANSTGIYLNGVSPTVPFTDLSSSGINLKSGDVFLVHAGYNGSVLTVTITDLTTGGKSTQSYNVDIPGTLGASIGYIGFTGGTGALTATQDILSWVYAPEPAFSGGFSGSQLNLNGGAALSGTKLRLLDNGLNEAHSAFFTTPVNVQRFTSTFAFKISNPSADGFAFVLQGQGATAIGGSGGALGYGGANNAATGGIPKSVALKFDLYNDKGEGFNSTGVYLNGASPTTPATALTGTGIDLHSGDPMSGTITYDGTTLVLMLVDTKTNASTTQSFKVDIPATVGSPTAYVGFTGGTGIQTATVDFQSWTYLDKPQFAYSTPSLTATTSGPVFRTFAWDGYPNGVGSMLDSTKPEDSVTLSINVPLSGVYDINVSAKGFPTRGVFQLNVDGVAAGPQEDEYIAEDGVLQIFDLGPRTLNAGKHLFQFKVLANNPRSTGYSLSFGQIVLAFQ